MLKLKAYAKINLTLEVLGRPAMRGYHEVTSVLQTVSLADTLALEPSPGPHLALSCSLASLEGEDNLALQAARLLKKAKGSARGARLRLEKAIPVAAGLGGGSSDAAAALRGLNRLWGLGLSPKELMALAARLGSDVGFFLAGGTALVLGRGEQVTPLSSLHRTWLVIVMPPVPVPEGKTARMYAVLEPGDFSGGERTQALLSRLASGRSLEAEYLHNAFRRPALAQFPGLAGHWGKLEKLAEAPAFLCGSGPALFTLAASEAQGQRLVGQLEEGGQKAFLVHTVSPQDKP